MNLFKEVVESYNTSNISNKDLLEAINNLYPAMNMVQENDPKCFWKAMRNFHKHIFGNHFNEMYAKYQVSNMFHMKRNGTKCTGEIYSMEEAKHIYDKYVRNVSTNYNCYDVYVAINAQYHDYACMYSEWYSDITKEELDNKIIASAIKFWFKDDDAEDGKVWNYFDINN